MPEKILIVEDEKNLRTLYKNEFKGEGYEVFLAKEGEEAINFYSNNKL